MPKVTPRSKDKQKKQKLTPFQRAMVNARKLGKKLDKTDKEIKAHLKNRKEMKGRR